MSEEDRDLAAEFDVEEWADVSPLPQDDGPAPLCAIAYPADCK